VLGDINELAPLRSDKSGLRRIPARFLVRGRLLPLASVDPVDRAAVEKPATIRTTAKNSWGLQEPDSTYEKTEKFARNFGGENIDSGACKG
jgi:hypothetical protein